jgi:AraC-like DNA-binding protein
MPILTFIISAVLLILIVILLNLFYAKQGNHMLNRLLVVMLFARIGQIIIYLLIISNQLAIFPFFLKLFTPFYFAAPACFYLYITGFIDDRTSFRKIEWLHFIPVILAIIHALPWHFSPPIQWGAVAKQIAENRQMLMNQRTGLFPAYFYHALMSLLIFGYLFATWHAVLTSRMIKEKEWDISKIWIFFCLTAATLFKLIGILPLIFEDLHHPLGSYISVTIANSVILLIVIIVLLHQPRLLYGYLLVSSNLKMNDPEPRQSERIVTSSPKSNLLPDQLSAYMESMKEFMVNEKLFLLPDFQIIHIAQKLNIPVHHCSFVINNVIGKNFRDWINGYRVNNFIQEYSLFADRMTIEAIAYKSGFKSVATFYNAFKKETGLMPTAYFPKKEQNLS